ncbi:MAG: biotin--[acetyl-CoA-carboxylase] ligase [Chlorobi bacterium]|nr:biotin--[acetyl-CoA-carboxylase] ligase [Chlorobiota bacterium]
MIKQADTEGSKKTPRIFSFDSLPSTNDKMKELLAEEELPEYTIVITDHQTSGRGQEGNSWESEKGKNLTFSILLRPEHLEPQYQFYISKAVSVAITETLALYGIDTEIKWPNDIYTGNKKIAGILIENELMGNFISSSIAGIGLNVNQTSFSEKAGNPVSMQNITGVKYDLSKVLNDLVNEMVRFCINLTEDEFQQLDERYEYRLMRRTGFHKYRDAKGEFLAKIKRIEPMGMLLLTDTEGKERRYGFKEVEFVQE